MMARRMNVSDHAFEQWCRRAPPIVGDYTKADVEEAWHRGRPVPNHRHYRFVCDEARVDPETELVLLRHGDRVSTVIGAVTGYQRRGRDRALGRMEEFVT